MTGTKDFERRLELIERSVQEIEASADAGMRATAQQLVQAVLELHAESLERLLEIVHGSGEPGQDIIDRLGRDGLVSKLLLLHSLHPLPLEARVIRALDTVRPTLRSQHGDVELLAVDEGRVRVRVVGNSAVASVIERAVLDAAPDVAGIEMEGVTERAAVVGFISLESLRGTNSKRHPAGTMAALAPGA
jgi:Fe-S cluster biogenesis protein NfuA